MILEYILDYRSNAQIFQKLFLNLLKKYSLTGKVIQNDFIVKCYVEIEQSDNFDSFSKEFAQKIPNSIFLYDSKVNVIDTMPDGDNIVLNQKLSMPFCIDCLNEVMDEKSKDYYNVYKQCDVCGYNIDGENKNYKKEIQEVANLISVGDNIKINTFYGTYIIGKIVKDIEDIDFDIIAYDYASVSKYTHATDYEIKTLASIEKPFIKSKVNLKFKTDIAEMDDDIYRFKLADDFILHLLLVELHHLGVDLIFITEEDIKYKEYLNLVTPKPLKPIEVVSSLTHVAIIDGEKGLPKFDNQTTKCIPSLNATYSVIKEHNLLNSYEQIVGIYLSKENQNTLLMHGKKYGTKNYLLMEFNLISIKDIFDSIVNTGETGEKLLNSYKTKFSDIYNNIIDIKFNKTKFNIYELWGIVSIILGFYDGDDISQASQELETNTLLFLGKKGPRIDYKLIQENKDAYIDPLMVIRSAISFKLAGIDNLTLSYGIMESFIEFLSNEIDNLKESMGIDAVVCSGSLFGNKQVFIKMVTELTNNHNVYFNNQLHIDKNNLFYIDQI